MPKLMSFADDTGTPTSYDFESIQSSRFNKLEGVKDASHVLVPYKSNQPVSALIPKLRRVDAFSAEPLFGKQTLYWTPQIMETYYSDGPSLVEVMRTFSLDTNEDEVLWLLMLGKLPPFFSKYFTSTIPSLWCET